MELKPFVYEAAVPLARDFTLTLRMDYIVIYELEQMFAPKGMFDLLGDLITSSSMMTQFLWFMTRKHHPDLNHDTIAGIQFSKKHGKLVAAAVGDIVKRAFDLKPAKAEAEVDG
jgi:hypothetical protein